MAKPTAKVFKSGNSQAVRLPAEFRFDVDEVFIEREGDKIILSPRPTSWDDFFSSRVRPTDDFMKERADTPPQARENL
jgi:antitoxin VapB